MWLAIGTGLRLTELAAKPPWTDEFSTIVFSLGNSFRTVPLDRAIAVDVLLQPLVPNPEAGVADVVRHLLEESNHPPLYFVLAHWWMQLFPPDGGLASVWAARALSVLFGALSIPAIYGLSWLAFRSQLVSQLTAAMMAVSPYGIFVAQEARQYTLAILWVIASLSCLAIATRHTQHQKPLPTWLVVSWVLINFLGVSTHYFFALTLITEALWLLILCWHQIKQRKRKTAQKDHLHLTPPPLNSPPWWQISIVAIGTTAGCLVWLPIFWQESSGGKLTEWIHYTSPGFLAWISPVFQALAGWIAMLSLLPVESPSLLVVIASGFVMLVFFIWAIPILWRGFSTQLQQPTTSLMTRLFITVVLGAIALFFLFAYVLGIDLTRGPRYNFVYFPAVVVLLGASLAIYWHSPQKKFPTGRVAVTLIWLMGLVSGLTIVNNLGYGKYYRPDVLIPLMQQVSHSPVVIATSYKTHVQTGEMMGIAKQLKSSNSSLKPLFFLAQPTQNPRSTTVTLEATLTQLPRPLDLWLVNFLPAVELNGCVADSRPFPFINGYSYKLYHCRYPK